MSTSMCKQIQSQFLSSSLRKEEEIMLLQKQGIVTILGHEEIKKNASSSEELSHSKVTTTNVDSNKGAPFDLWSSILLPQKAKDETTNAIITPYIHPHVKKSKSSLSQKSLEICTESLGSETGSDGFSSEEYKEETKQQQHHNEEVVVAFDDLQVPQCKSSNITTTSDSKISLKVMSVEILDQRPKKCKSLHRSFPPPLSSLRMVSHRDDGKLLLQAVFVPCNNNFHAKRQDGRLVLTFASEEEESQARSMEEYDDDDEGEEEKQIENDEENNGGRNVENEIEKATMILSSGIITSVHKLALVLNNKAKWSEKFNESVLHRPRLARLKRQLWHQHQQQQLRLLSLLLMKNNGGPSPLQKLLNFLTHLPINNI